MFVYSYSIIIQLCTLHFDRLVGGVSSSSCFLFWPPFFSSTFLFSFFSNFIFCCFEITPFLTVFLKAVFLSLLFRPNLQIHNLITLHILWTHFFLLEISPSRAFLFCILLLDLAITPRGLWISLKLLLINY